jgi:hypothetical protein
MSSDDFATALAVMLEQMAPIREAAQGYREQLRRDGWSVPVSEQMAAELHNQMTAAVFGQSGGRR